MIDQNSAANQPSHVLEDPSVQAVAQVYADSLLGAAKKIGVDEVLEELESFLDDVLKENPEYQRLLLSGLLNREDKLQLIDRTVGGQGSSILVNFLKVLATHDRLVHGFLPVVLDEARKKHEANTGRKRVQVTSARPLSEQSLAEITERLKKSFSFDPILETSVDESLLGGIVIQVDDTVYDSSLKTRMKQLRSRLSERSLHEIQSGRDRFSHPEGD